ncbi:unnamed protein product [Penicillium salamii]|nr:unnamed protein product [Penicillium salamii]
MTVQSTVEKIDSVEKCIFPIRNDGNVVGEGETTWDHIDICTCTLPGLTARPLCKPTCPNHGLQRGLGLAAERDDALYFLATVWARILSEYAEVDFIRIGVCQATGTFTADMAEKSQMEVYVATRIRMDPVSEFLSMDRWSVLPAKQSDYPYFNTGIAVCQDPEVKPDTGLEETVAEGQKSSREEVDEEQCSIMLALNTATSRLSLFYKTSILSTGQAGHMASLLAETMGTLAGDATSEPLTQLALTSGAQKRQIKEWNSQELVQSAAPTIHQIIRNLSLTQADHPALMAADGTLTYAELDAVSSQLARHLQSLGVTSGKLIPVCFNKSVWAIVAMLAINKAGAGFVPLDAAQPLSRLKLIVNQLDRPPVGLTSPQNQELMDQLITSTLAVDTQSISALPSRAADETIQGADQWPVIPTAPSYCFFTSGSTGEPKGCLVDHAALASVETQCKALHLDSNSRVLQFASFSFGVSLIEIWCTLLAGGTVCMPSDSDRVSNLADAIRSMAMNWAFVTPTVLSTIDPESVPDLQTILVAGEPLKKAQISLWADRTHLFQAYGFTEWAGVCCVSPQIHSVADLGIIGTPANAHCWLIEPDNPHRIAPIGAVAELFVEGPSLAQGYLNNPERTALGFLEAPAWRQHELQVDQADSGDTAGVRCYKTGDLAHYDSNGLLRYVSRRDRQVKVRGQRIDLGEPEFHITQASPLFRKAVIDAIEPADGNGVAGLVAFVEIPSSMITPENSDGGDAFFTMPDPEFVENAQRSIEILEQKLPDVMIPRLFLQISHMPLTVTGKIDRLRLRKEAEQLRHEELLAWSGVTTGAVAVPQTLHEVLIHQIVVELLSLSPTQVGMEHSFFALGGDSVKAMKMVSRARAAGLELKTTHIFAAANLRELARIAAELGDPPLNRASSSEPFDLLDAQSKQALISNAALVCGVEEFQIENMYPCTPLQEGMMALSMEKPGTYIARFVHQLQPHVDLVSFRRAWEAVFQACPILRTRLATQPDSNSMFQVVLREYFQWDDTSPNMATWDTYMKPHPTDKLLLGSPLVHAGILAGSDSSKFDCDTSANYFIVMMHHSICDRWSYGLMMDMLEKSYAGEALVMNSPAPFIKYLSGQLSDSSSETYWRSRFEGNSGEVFPALPSPTYTPVPSSRLQISIPWLRDVPSGHTMSNVIRLAWAMVVSHYTSSPDVVFGVTVSGRAAPVADIDKMVAPIVATIPLRVLLSSKDTIRTALDRIHKQSNEMVPFEQFGLQRIRKVSSEAADGCGFQSKLIVQPRWADEHRPLLETLEAGSSVAGGFSSWALSVSCSLTDSRKVDVTMDFDQLVLSAPEVKRISQHFEQTLQFLLTEPSLPLEEVPYLSSMDLEELRQWDEPITQAQECHECVHELIQRRCLEQPTADAVWSWDGKLTYAELDQVSTRLAAHLIETCGVKTGVIVPICMEKTLWTTVAIVAIIKTGGAFVLLNSSQPSLRLASICDRVQSVCIITSPSKLELAQTLAPVAIVASQDQSEKWPLVDACTPMAAVQESSILYVAFTSGSTGIPKGALLDHRALRTSALALNTAAGLTCESRLLQLASYSFDVCIMDTLGALIAGACVCVLSDLEVQNELAIAGRRFLLTHAHTTPSIARHILRSEPNFAKVLICGGEPLTPADVADWAGKPTCRVMNAYGPAECAVDTTIQSITAAPKPQNIGFPLIGVCCFVAHPDDHNVLLPIGAVGELLVEGPTVGHGYVGDEAQSKKAFLSSPPAWMRLLRPEGSYGRIYKTGDLVRYNDDGSLQYVGRRDTQVKVRGQRIELGEVENHVRQAWPNIDQVAVEMTTLKIASSSPATQSLAAFIVMTDVATNSINGTSDDDLPLAEYPSSSFQNQAADTHAELQDRMPLYMVPEIFVPLRYLPKSASGKLDRRRLRGIVEGCAPEELALYRLDSVKGSIRAPTTDAERKFHNVWAHVLNRPPDEFGVDDNFYHMGGDSITAMQIVAQARFKGLRVSSDEILRHKTISEIVLHSEHSMAGLPIDCESQQQDEDEAIDTWFDLSPIQQMFVDQQPEGTNINRYNQTFLLRVKQPISLEALQAALGNIQARHHMLRAQFATLPDNGRWMQKILPAGLGEDGQWTQCYCTCDRVQSRSDLEAVATAATQLIDVEQGPLTVVNLVEVMEDHSQFLLLATHHLVIDLGSWRVILADLNTLLAGETLPEKTDSISFQSWCRRQAQYAQQSLSPQAVLPCALPQSYHEDKRDFWFMSPHQSNCMGDTQLQSFTLDQKSTRLLFEAAQVAYDCQPAEVLHAGLLFSFLETFRTRDAPIIFDESHGRESWNSTINLGQTVGWFTTFWPVLMSADLKHDRQSFHRVLRLVKDARRSVPHNGWAYFTSLYLNTEGRSMFHHPQPMEIIFNYAGEFQQLERANAMFNLVSHESQAALDVGNDIQRFGIFEVGVSVQNGSLRIQFVYPREIQHEDYIHQWMKTYQETLQVAAYQLQAVTQSNTHSRYTLSDFPLLPSLTYPELQELAVTTLPALGISVEDVAQIYPCSPSQQGMLIAQAKAASNYNGSVTWAVSTSMNGERRPLDSKRLYAACVQVIKRHAALRTVFVESPRSGSYMEQVVLRDVKPEIVLNHTSLSASDPPLPGSMSDGWHQGELMHRMNLFTRKVDGQEEVMLRIDISHAITDRTTMQIIQRDLGLAYDGKLFPGTGPLFSEYVSYIERQDGENDSRYWQKYLQGVEPCLFPRLGGNENAPANEFGHVSRRLPQDSMGNATIDNFCRRHSITMWNLAALAWALVLRSFTNSDHICFGYVKSGRDLPIDGIQDAVGAIFNPLTCRVSFAEESTVEHTIDKLKQEYLDSLRHQCFPLSKAHRLAGISDGSLFNSSVEVQRSVNLRDADGSLDFTTLAKEDGAEEDLIMMMIPGTDNTILDLRYKTRVLSPAQASTVLLTFEKAIQSILTADGNAPITSVDILSEGDFDLIWTRNQNVPPRVESSVHHIIHERYIENPNSEAVCDTEGSFTYRELEVLSSSLARHLIVNCGGLLPDEVIPIYMTKSRWTPVAMLAVLKAGGTILLLDTSHPPQRRLEMCAEVEARTVISSPEHASLSQDLATSVVLLGPEHCAWDVDCPANGNANDIVLPTVQPGDAVYVVFTSGSTGKPKGVVIDHGSYCTGARDHNKACDLTRHSRVTQFASYAFDMSLFEQLSILMAGGCVCVVSEEQRKDSFGEVCSRLNANFAVLVPSVARLFRPEDLPTIRTLVLGGECMTQIDVASWAPHVRLINGYGPAECSPVSVVQSSICTSSDPRNIGNPVGCVLWVVDPNNHHKLVPPGSIGELVIEGPIVGRGYIKRPEQTAQAFVKPPAWLQALRPTSMKGSRLYKTGDLVRSNPDGSLLVLGRKDRQVKLRGQRLELAEVEFHVQRSFGDAVHDVVTQVILPVGSTKPQLVAMILTPEEIDRTEESPVDEPRIFGVPSDSFATQMAAAEVRLRQQIPDFMVPSVFIPVVHMPRTQSGKVDINRLRKLATAMSLESLQKYRAPASSSLSNESRLCGEAEHALARIWATLLDIPMETISRSDNFFFRGGHSIDAMKASALGRAAGMGFGVADIFDHPILSDLAKVAFSKEVTEHVSWKPFSLSPVEDPQALHADLSAKRIIPASSTLQDVLPATQAQRLFIDRGTFHSYNWTIKGRSLDIDRLRKACQALTERHSILRTSFVEHDGQLIQLVLANCDVQLREIRCWPDEDPLDVCKALWDSKDCADLVFVKGSMPVRFTLVSRPGDEHVILTIQISHAQWDGVSIPRLFGDLAAIYNETSLAPTSQFADYLYHLASTMADNVKENPTFSFWREYLSGAEMAVPFPPRVGKLMVDPGAAAQSDHSLWGRKGISPPPSVPSGVTMAALVKAAVAFYLSRYQNQTDIVFGHTVNGRNLPLDNIESLLGCTLNFVPLRITFPSGPAEWTVMDLLSHAQNQYIRALSHEHVELRDIFHHSTDWPAEKPLSLIVQHQNIDLIHKLPLQGNASDNEGADDSALDVQLSRFFRFDPLDEVWIFTEPHADRLDVQVCANSRVLQQAEATNLAENVAAIIEKFSANPMAKLAEIEL